jgi:hypothetical protein
MADAAIAPEAKRVRMVLSVECGWGIFNQTEEPAGDCPDRLFKKQSTVRGWPSRST